MRLQIGVLAKATGTKIPTIRYYEEIGLLPTPDRSTGNYRVYGEAHLHRLTFVRRCRELGLCLDQIRELLGLADDEERPCTAVETIVREHRATIERKIRELQELDRELARVIDQCGQGKIIHCGILKALAP